jgi:hypothetical protein
MANRKFPPPWSVEVTAEQAATPKRLAEAAYELDAFKPARWCDLILDAARDLIKSLRK